MTTTNTTEDTNEHDIEHCDSCAALNRSVDYLARMLHDSSHHLESLDEDQDDDFDQLLYGIPEHAVNLLASKIRRTSGTGLRGLPIGVTMP
jgi:hypothetical protein